MDAEEIENEELEARVQAVVAQWGESFEKAARSPRFEFDGSEIVIRLWKKIKVNGQDADTLRMVEPSLNDLEKLDSVKGSAAQAKRMIVSTCSLTDREAGQLGMRDIMLISQLTEAFTAAAPATGSTF